MLIHRRTASAVATGIVLALGCGGESHSARVGTKAGNGGSDTAGGGSGGAHAGGVDYIGESGQGGTGQGGSSGSGSGNGNGSGYGGTNTAAGAGGSSGAGNVGTGGGGNASGRDLGDSGEAGERDEHAGAAGQPVGGAGGSGGSTSAPVCRPDCGSHKWACWPMPNPAGSGLPNEASYTDNGETVLDNITCLEWQKAQPKERYDWSSAIEYCENLTLGGYDDWRLPARIELVSLVRFGESPGIDTDMFGNPYSQDNWAGSRFHDDGGWSCSSARVWPGLPQSGARCVRSSGLGEAPTEPAVAPENLYSEIAPGEIRDNYTGLIWQQGQSSDALPYEDADAYCSSLALGGKTWRVPTPQELLTLVDEAREEWVINPDFFPDTERGYCALAPVSDTPLPRPFGFDAFEGLLSLAVGGEGEGWVKCVR